MNPNLSKLVKEAVSAAQEAERARNWDQAWESLAEAHIFSQSDPWLHSAVHWKMLGLGWRQRNWREIQGQVLRLLLAAPGSILGKYPVGNTGRSNVSAFQAMPVSDRIREKLSAANDEGGRKLS